MGGLRKDVPGGVTRVSHNIKKWVCMIDCAANFYSLSMEIEQSGGNFHTSECAAVGQ